MFVDEERSGGAATVFVTGSQSFSLPMPTLSAEGRRHFFSGNASFNRNWDIADGSNNDEGHVGLGPTFHVRSCSGCHFLDGRSAPPDTDEPISNMVIALSIEGSDGAPVDHPAYGGQLQPNGIEGVPGEVDIHLDWEEVPGEYGDGTAYSLRRPTLRTENLAFGPLGDSAMFSVRTAPHVAGLGLLEVVAEDDLLALADPDDDDGDGISGRAHMVADLVTGDTVVGRFGWKASRPTLDQQNAGAFLGDMGITSSLFPNQNCTDVQVDCQAAPEGRRPEVDDTTFDRVSTYTHFLAPPARRDVDDATVVRGRGLFVDIGCADCHAPRLDTPAVVDAYPELAGHILHPYTDLLLHDMGEDLADHRPQGDANGLEWRTTPLWGIGLFRDVNDHELLLHDGRARGLAEAILWHGGEGEESKEAFRNLPADDRDAVLRFLESL